MKRIAVVDNEKLRDMSQKQHIQNLCPVNRAGTECIEIGSTGFMTIDEVSCIGCGICVKASPEAIKIINLPEILDKRPIHRYGENQFALFSIPTPLFDNVVGILGVNGIGKSTAISIVARLLQPNFGDYENKGSNEEENFKKLIEYFKGTEIQKYFEQVKDGKISVSFKPQHVEQIPKQAKGPVRSLLEKVSPDKEKNERIIEQLDLKNILENNIETLSGGELQRVAIAAAMLKRADLYVFDEPTSFLDIKQRMNTSKAIRSLKNEKTAVLLVEHDLIILDYLSDMAEIMYGSEDAYGALSGIKPAKNAINVYLEGFLKEENIRFRDKQVKFEKRQEFQKKEQVELVSWKGLKKQLDQFSLVAAEGAIHKGEVIGVLGENGIGKTTFVKILAGVIKKDEGTLNENLKVSYKPQYIEASDELVMAALHKAIDKYTNQIIDPLTIKPLFMKKLNELSGGELQRVSIAKCLSEDAALYLLDEPSAYLDVEQRLLISKVIRDFMEQKGTAALIVDHDILFLDYLSDSLMVFDGTPARNGIVEGPFSQEEGMNRFLKRLNITLRRDKESNMPRINKLNSRLDREQKEKGRYYYS